MQITRSIQIILLPLVLAGFRAGAQLARRLFVIINRATWVDIDELLDDPAGHSNDNLPAYRDSIGVVLGGDKEIRLLMQRVPRGERNV
jgi:MscS family membrane protein